MFCPFCKAEYRVGIALCSDCSFPLVKEIPKDDSDPNFMVLLWNGESLPFLEAVCAELDRAQIPVATPRLDVLLRDPADRYHLEHLKTFPYVLGVLKRNFVAARKILESVAEKSFPPITLAATGAYPEPFDERATIARGGKSPASLDATTTICSSHDLRYVEFLEASLDGLDIPYRRVCLETDACEVQVCPSDAAAAREVMQEIASGASTQAIAAALEDSTLYDEPPKSYFLAWLLPIAYWFVFSALFVFSDDKASNTGVGMFALLLGAMEAVSVIGSFWMVYQALRYEVKPFRYCVMALLPLMCVWYYVERYSVRKGAQRLPIAARVRAQPPSS